MNHSVVACLLAAMLSASAPSAAQEAYPGQSLSDYTLTSWTDANGLRLGAIYSIAQDQDGYLWIAADTGLLRFDGLRFSSWNLTSESPLPDSSVSAVCVSRDGSVWVAMSAGGGVFRIRDGHAERIDKGLPSPPITSLIEDRPGSLLGVTETGLWVFREGAWAPLAAGLPKTGLLSGYVTKAGDLLVGTIQGLFRRVAATGTFERVAPWWTFSISEDPQGVLWTTDIRMGFRQVGSNDREAPRGNGYRLVHDRHGDLWVGTVGQGLWRVRRGRTEIDRVGGLLSDSVLALYEDREGNIWAGTTAGLHRLTRHTFLPLNVGFVVAIESTPDNVWAGTWRGLVRLTRHNGEWVADGNSATEYFIRALHHDSQGSLWVGSDHGLDRLTDGHLERVASVPGRGVTSIASDNRGRIWLTGEGRVFRLEGRALIPFTYRNETPQAVTYLYGDKTGRLWIVFERGDRLALLEPDATLHEIALDEMTVRENPFPIHSIFQDRGGVVWISSSAGVIRYEHGRTALVNRNSGLPGNRVWAIAEDDNGFLWLNMDLGIVRVHQNEFVTAMADRDHRIRYRIYDAADGLTGAPLRNVRASRAHDGSLWFVRGGGLTMVDPRNARIDDTTAIGPVRIESASTGTRNVEVAPGTRLPPGTRRLEITYTAVTLTSPTEVNFRYRLDGFDADWIDVGPRREAVYTNLPPGNYRFRVEATSIEGSWAESTALWSFTMAPMFYQTRWFYVSCVAGALVVVWGVWALRLRFVRKQFAAVLAERTRLSHEIHDTLLQGITGVALQLDHMSKNASSLPRQSLKHLMRRMVEQIQMQIREARQSISDLRSPTLEAKDLATALRDFGTRATTDIRVRFVTTVTGSPRRYPFALENQILRIGQEAIVNAVRHSQATQIELQLHYDDTSIRLRVSDDGCGLDAARLAGGNNGNYGLKTMRERAEQVRGHLTIVTTTGGGTAIEASIPVSGFRAA